MPDIEFLNILNIDCNPIGTEKKKKGAIAMQARIASLVQEVKSAVQTQAPVGVVLRQTSTQAATQTERE